MSDMNDMNDMSAWNASERAGDPLAPEVIEDTIAHSLRVDAPNTSTATLVRSLANAYALPPAADAALARSRATLAHRAEALGAGGLPQAPTIASPDESWSAPTRPVSRPAPSPWAPQPPRHQRSHVGRVWRTAAAVLIVALLGAGFYALLREAPGLGGHLIPKATQTPASSTTTPGATPSDTPSATATATIAPQPPAPAGVYITSPGTLLRLNSTTGAIQQRYPFALASTAYVGAPVVGNGVVYFTFQHMVSPWDSGVIAVSATSGAELWRVPTAARLTQLSLVDGVLYGGTEGTGTGSDTFYALRASDGGVLWTFQTATLRGVALISGGVVYLADQPEGTPLLQHLHALRASDGTQLWDIALPQACEGVADGAADPGDQGTIIVSCIAMYANGVVYGVRASDGGLLWHSDANGQPTIVAAGAGLVYVSVGGKNAAGALVSSLYALDETSGAARWQAPHGSGWPVFAGGVVYAEIGSNLTAFSASSGAVLWTYSEADHRIELNPPVIVGGVVYQALDGQIVAISAANGAVLWRSPVVVSQQNGVSGLWVVTGG